MSAIAGAYGGTTCAKAIGVNVAIPSAPAQPPKLTTLWAIPSRKEIRFLIDTRRSFPGRYDLFQLFRRLRGLIGFDPGYGCRWGLWGTALHRLCDTLAGFFRTSQRRGLCAGCGIGLRSQVGSGIGVAEADMLELRASLTDCRKIVSEGVHGRVVDALPCILPGCSPEHRILRRRHVKQL